MSRNQRLFRGGRIALTAALLCAPMANPACGARSELEVWEGAQGSGGAPPERWRCDRLEWAGPPVRVPVGETLGTLQSVELAQIDESQWALLIYTYGPYSIGGDETRDRGNVYFATIDDPFSAWPPEVGTPAFSAAGRRSFASVRGVPGRVAVATVAFDFGGSVELSMVGDPNGVPTHSTLVPISPGDVYAVARADDQTYAIAVAGDDGSSTNRSALHVAHVSPFPLKPGGQPPLWARVGPLGCASEGLKAKLALAPERGFILASVTNAASGECAEAEPLGVADTLQVHIVTEASAELRSTIPDELGVTALELIGTIDGAVLGVGRAGDASFELRRVDPEGRASDPYWRWAAGAAEARFAASALGPVTAVAGVLDPGDRTRAALQLLVAMTDPPAPLSISSPSLLPASDPAIAHQEASRSVLLAVIDGDASEPTVALLRADCQP